MPITTDLKSPPQGCVRKYNVFQFVKLSISKAVEQEKKIKKLKMNNLLAELMNENRTENDFNE